MDRLKLIILTTPHRLSDRTWHFTATDPKTGKRYHCSTSNWRISRCGVFDEIEVSGVLGGEELIERFSAFDNHSIINVDYYVMDSPARPNKAKVGITNSIDRRVQQLHTGDPRIRCLHFFEVRYQLGIPPYEFSHR
ncbi:MAG: hypothetical protein HWE12_03550 [Oceanospirillaceae bacterium]|nr:hypothetical protein [Oceanospirillaceae bacterium]